MNIEFYRKQESMPQNDKRHQDKYVKYDLWPITKRMIMPFSSSNFFLSLSGEIQLEARDQIHVAKRNKHKIIIWIMAWIESLYTQIDLLNPQDLCLALWHILQERKNVKAQGTFNHLVASMLHEQNPFVSGY